MSQALTPALQALTRTVVRRRRELPVRGEVTAKVGDVVVGDAAVAQALLPGELRILRIAESLGLTPEEVTKALLVREGQRVEAGALVCEYVGLFGLLKSRYHSPVTGVVEVVSEQTGHVGVRLPSEPIRLSAYLSGTVAEVEEGLAVTIQAEATFVQGIFGVGGERFGIVRTLGLPRTERIGPQHIPADCGGAILVGGTAPTIEALKVAAERGAVGLVCGSIDDSALHEYLGYDLGIALTGDEVVPMTVVVTEGFGNIPLSANLDRLLGGLDGRAGSLNGATQVRAGAVRPELIVTPALGTEQSTPHTERRGLEVGSPVRLIRVPYFGKLGNVTELPSKLVQIETGALTRVVHVKLDSGETVVVPRANVELLARDSST